MNSMKFIKTIVLTVAAAVVVISAIYFILNKLKKA